MKLSKFVIVIFFCNIGVIHAESKGQALSGAGTGSCGEFLSRESDTTAGPMYVSWAQGFLSGMNLADNASAKRPFVLLPDGNSIMKYIRVYCSYNPLMTPMDATIQLYLGLRSKAES